MKIRFCLICLLECIFKIAEIIGIKLGSVKRYILTIFSFPSVDQQKELRRTNEKSPLREVDIFNLCSKVPFS